MSNFVTTLCNGEEWLSPATYSDPGQTYNMELKAVNYFGITIPLRCFT